MTDPRAPGPLRLLARLLPRDFRREFEAELLSVATRRVEQGRSGVVNESLDLLRTVVREHARRVASNVADYTRGGGEPMGTLTQDVRYALRMLWKTPVVSAIAAISLALGIAATASTMAMADGFIFSQVPWDDGDEIVSVTMRNPTRGVTTGGGLSAATFAAIDDSDLFAELALYTTSLANISEEGLDPEQVQHLTASPEFLDITRASPMVGRSFTERDAVEGAVPTVVLMHPFWERRYGADPSVVGRSMRMAGLTRTIVGVMPEDFELIPANVQVISPANFADQIDDHRRRFLGVGRLESGITTERANAEIATLQAGVASSTDPTLYEGWDVQVEYFSDTFPGPTDRRLIQILLAVSLFGLMIACANVANLLLGRAEQRQREVSVRTALGAGRDRILRQLLTESVVLAALAGAMGLALSRVLVGWFEVGMPAELPRSLYPELSAPVLILSCVVTLGAGVLFGLAPALHAVKGELRDTLTGARGGTAGRGRRRVRNAFVISEFAVALALLTGAGILVKAFQTISSGDSGFDAAGVMTFFVSPSNERYPDTPSLQALQRDALDALEARPEIARASLMSQLPRSRAAQVTFYDIDGHEPPARPSDFEANWIVASTGFAETLDVPMEQGRFFTDADGPETLPVAVISRAFADRHFADEDPIGQTLRLTRDQTGPAADGGRRIVGVIGDLPQQRLELNARPTPTVYVSADQTTLRTAAFAVEAASGPGGAMAGDAELARAAREAILSVDPGLPAGSMKTLETHVEEQLAGPTMIGVFVAGIGGIALLLAALGIYGVMAHSVVQRTREIGIRMAMGAERGTVVGMVARSGFSLVLVGMLAGMPIAWLMFRLIQSALGELTGVLSPLPPFLFVTAVLISVASIATLLPALRASRIRPARALGEE